MCGYCTERAMLAQRVRALELGAACPLDALLLPVHLQEVRDWRRTWAEAPATDDLVATLVMLCRAWSDRFAGATGATLQDLLPPASQARLQEWIVSLALPGTWAWLADDGAPLPETLPVQAARDELDAYLGGWLRVGQHAEPCWDEIRLHERLLCLSVALDVLLHAAPDDERITTLALSSPRPTSPFSAIDLWLQRRAVRALLAPCNSRLTATLLARLRSDSVLAAILRGGMDEDDLRVVQAALRQRLAHTTEGIRDLHTALALMLAPPTDARA